VAVGFIEGRLERQQLIRCQSQRVDLATGVGQKGKDGKEREKGTQLVSEV
jgi:hypothetical protein